MLRARRRRHDSSAASSSRGWRTCARRRRALRSAARAISLGAPAVSGAGPHRPAAAGRLRATGDDGRHAARSATPKPRAAASTSAATARWCRCTAASFRVVQPRCRAGGHPPAGGRRRRAHHVRRSGFLQRPGPRDARLWRRSTAEWPALTYDVTIKVEHLLKHRELLPVLKRDRLRVRHQRGGIAGRRGAGEARQRATRAPDFLEALRPDARARPAAGADVHPVSPVDHARELSRIPARAGGTRTWRTQVAPIQLAIRLLIPEGSLLLELPEVRAHDRAVRSARPVLSLAATAIPRWTRSARRFRRPIKRGRAPARDACRDLPEDLGPCRSRRVSGSAAAGARDDPVSDGALVLLSGAYGRAVSSCVISVELQCMIWSGTSGLRRAGRWKPRSGSASQSNHRATAQHWSLKERS